MLEIKEVLTRAELKRFVDYPNVLYGSDPHFVPATYADDMEDWDRAKNPAFAYCEARCWLAYREGEIVGRIGAILNKRANEKWHTNRMRFTQVDFIDDREVSAALFCKVEDWAREKGCGEVHGPLGFTDLDREGMLVEGFDRRSLFFTYYNRPYYIEHLTALGYVKDVDWIENCITVPKDDAAAAKLKRVAEYVQKRYDLHIAAPKTRLGYRPLIPAFFRLVNECYAPLYATVELSEDQIARYAKKFGPLINPNLTCFVMDKNNEMIGMGVGAPNLSEAMRKSRGRMFPFGWARMLKALYVNDTVDLLLIGVRPEYQSKGVNAIIMNKMAEGARKMGITHAETGPTLETNLKLQSQWRDLEKVQHKRRRCFKKSLAISNRE